MSGPTPSRISVRKTLKTGSVSRQTALIAVLRLVIKASSAFTPLQSAASILLKVLDQVDVWSNFSLSFRIALIVSNARQKAAQNTEDIAALEDCFSRLLDLLNGPLKDAEACPPALLQRIGDLSLSLQIPDSLSSACDSARHV